MGTGSSRNKVHTNVNNDLPTIQTTLSDSIKSLKIVSFRNSTPEGSESIYDARQRKRFREIQEAEALRAQQDANRVNDVRNESTRKEIVDRKHKLLERRLKERIRRREIADKEEAENIETQQMYRGATLPENEPKRLRAQQSFRMKVKSSETQVNLDRITKLAQRRLKMPIVIVSFIDKHLQFIEASQGIDIEETCRNLSLCAWTVKTNAPLIVKDATVDTRFSSHPFVVDAPGVRFYAGVPLVSSDGFSIGAFSVMDTVPHPKFGKKQEEELIEYSHIVMRELELSKNMTIAKRSEDAQIAVCEYAQQVINMTDATNAYDLGTLTLCENMDVDLASLLTVKPNNGNELLSSVGFFDAKSALRSEPIIAHMLENQMTFICEDIKESPFAIPTFLLKQNIQSMLVAVVKRDGNPYAILSVYKVEQHRWSRDEIAFLEGMARTLGGIAEKHHAAHVLAEAKQKSDRLLGQMLPASTIRQLQAQEDSNLAEGIANATVMFADIVGFTELANSIRPKELVQFLSFIFCAIDELAEKHGVMKVKTVGDAYMCATGVVSHEDDHAEVMLLFAFEVINFVNSPEVQTKHPISIRIGISSGPVVAGVIGKQRQVYDIYGDTVNVAARMESLGQPQRIQISKKTLDMLIRNDTTSQFVIEPRGTIAVKGKGKMDTMWASPVKKETTVAGKETKPEIGVA